MVKRMLEICQDGHLRKERGLCMAHIEELIGESTAQLGRVLEPQAEEAKRRDGEVFPRVHQSTKEQTGCPRHHVQTFT